MIFLVKAIAFFACALFACWLVVIFIVAPIVVLWSRWRDQRAEDEYLAPSHDDEDAERCRLARSIAHTLYANHQHLLDPEAYTLDDLRAIDAMLQHRAEQLETDRIDRRTSL